MKPTLRTLAEAAGVSITTASNCMTGTGRVAPATQQRVREMAERLGYLPPRRRGHQRTRQNVAVLVSVENQWAATWRFILPIIRSIEQTLRAHGYSTVLLPMYDADEISSVVTRIRAVGPVAAAPLHYGSAALYRAIEREGIPVVVLMNSAFQDSFSSVLADDIQGVFYGVQHLISLGHRHIAFLGCERPGLRMLRTDRTLGYRKALELADIPADSCREMVVDPADFREIQRALSSLMADPAAPTALFCLDDELAIQAVQALHRQGFRIPHEISIMAAGDVVDHDAPTTDRPLTTMRIDTEEVGRTAGRIILSRLSPPPSQGVQRTAPLPEVAKINLSLIDRGSCAPPVASSPVVSSPG